MIWIIDASVAVKWFIEEENDESADEVLNRVVRQPENFAVPELFGFEVYAVLERLLPNGNRAYCEGIIPILQSGILRQPMSETLASKAHNFVMAGLTGYDACYAAMAHELKGIWLTFDRQAHEKIKNNKVSWILQDGLPADWNS